MTGIELLRKYAEAGSLTLLTCGHMPEALGKECDDFRGCKDCHMFVCNTIADRIERETLPRPLFEDGEPVQFGDCISVEGCKETVQGFKFYRSGPVFVSIVGRDHEKWVRIEEGDRVKRPEPPDTWEKLVADIEDCDGSACNYFGRIKEEGRAPCCGCKAYNDDTDCTVQVMCDIVRRAKKLAGVE